MRRWIWYAVCLAAIAVPVAAAAQAMPHEQLPFDCSKCHQNAADRSDIGFDHSEVDFELIGHHATVGCARCHDLADFARADDRCFSCHTDVHQGRLYPDCGTCHSPTGWDVIDPYGAHARTAFQLMGVHTTLDCDSCHEREIIAERSELAWGCYDCHRTEYETNQMPPHAEYGFPTGCGECHMQLDWRPTFTREHPGDFPIFVGTHAGEWTECTDCHGSTGTWLPFSCLGCHKHNEADMAEEHEEVDFYYYDSYGCYGCHPMGIAEEDD
jgi:hypothetical protein